MRTQRAWYVAPHNAHVTRARLACSMLDVSSSHMPHVDELEVALAAPAANGGCAIASTEAETDAEEESDAAPGLGAACAHTCNRRRSPSRSLCVLLLSQCQWVRLMRL